MSIVFCADLQPDRGRRPTDPGADFLNGRHEWKSEQHRPASGEAELRTCLTISGDTRGIVVGCSRDQARPECLQKRKALFSLSLRRFSRLFLHAVGGTSPKRSDLREKLLKHSLSNLLAIGRLDD